MKTCNNCACDLVCDHNWNGWETCGNWIQKSGEPRTNADRIRAMSDEEIATMLFDYKECSKNCIMNNGKHCYEICEEKSVILEWLQQPAKEDT